MIIYSFITIAYMIIIKKNAKDVEKLVKDKTKVVDAKPEVDAEAE